MAKKKGEFFGVCDGDITMEDEAKIIVLDLGGDVYYPQLENREVQLIRPFWEVGKIERRGMRSLTYNEPTFTEQRVIQKALATKNIDLIVIGNNMDYGLYRAELIPRDMRADKTCIVWNHLPEDPWLLEDEVMPYKERGFNTFLSRRNFEPYFMRRFF